MDIDHFKKINDTYGHLAGDQVLVSLATFISESIRSKDIFARWGGEEFILILQSEDIEAATELGRRLLARVEEKEFEVVGHITISIGVTSYSPGDSPMEVVLRADEALYHSKNKGRNRISAM